MPQERSERKTNPDLLMTCRSRYGNWTSELLVSFEPDSPPKLVTEGFYEELIKPIRPDIVQKLREMRPIESLIDAQPTPSERNAVREAIVREVTGQDPLAVLREEKVRRRIRAAAIDLFVAIQAGENGAQVFEDVFAPRAWHWIKDDDVRGLRPVDHITHLTTKEGDKLASVSPRELSYAVGLLS